MCQAELLDYLKLLESKIDFLTDAVDMQKKRDKLMGEWVEEKVVMAMTGLSRNTLLRLRQQGHIIRSTLSGKSNFYRLSDFKKLLDKNEKEN